MDQHELTFVIPTYRLRDVGETVEQYDQHFWRNGHSRLFERRFDAARRAADYVARYRCVIAAG